MSCPMCEHPEVIGMDAFEPRCFAEIGIGQIEHLRRLNGSWDLVVYDDCDGVHSERVRRCPWCGHELEEKGPADERRP